MSKASSAIMDRMHAALCRHSGDSIAARLVRGTSGTAFMKLFNMAAGFVTAVLLGRFLGVTEFGIYSYAVSWITLLGVLAQAGIVNVTVRNIAVYHQEEDWARIRGMLRFSVLVVTVAGALCAGALALVAWLLHSDTPAMRNALWFACLLLLLKTYLVPFGAVQRGFQQITYSQIPLYFIMPAVFLLTVISVHTLYPFSLDGSDAILLRSAAVGVSILVAVKLLYMGFNRVGSPGSLPRPIYHPRQWLASAAPMVLVGSMFLVNSNADILMLGSIIGAEAAGVYKAATRGADLVALSLAIINVPLAPIVARLYAAGEKLNLQRTLTRCARIAFIPAVLLTILLITKGTWFLQIFGTEFATREGSLSLAILSIGQLINVTAGSVGMLLMMTRHESYAARAMTASAILNVVLNAILIPIAGLIGAAIATAISTIAWNLLLMIFAFRCLKLNPTIVSLPLQKIPGEN